MGKKARLKKERRHVKDIDGGARSELTVDHMVLAIALGRASIEHVRLYLSKGADIDTLAEVGQSMLHIASAKGNLDLVRFLLEQGADPNRRGNLGYGALHMAVESDNPDVIRALWEAGALPNDESEDGKTPLQRAVQLGNAKAVSALGEAGASFKDLPADEVGTISLLMVAVAGNLTEVIKALVKMGANPDVGNEGMSPLMLAVRGCKTETVQTLLSCGADFTVYNLDGRTALSDAVRLLNLGAAKALLDAGADPNQPDSRRNLPLRTAVGTGYLETIRVLLDAGAEVNAVGGFAITALKWAGRLAAPGIVQMLLERGADASQDGGDGLTPMHLVALSSVSPGFIVPSHFRQQANYRDIAAAIRTARQTAHGMPLETVRALVKSGAAVDAKSRKGETPLSMAAGIGESKVTSMILGEEAIGSKDTLEAMKENIGMVRGKVSKVIAAFLENGADIEQVPLTFECLIDMV